MSDLSKDDLRRFLTAKRQRLSSERKKEAAHQSLDILYGKVQPHKQVLSFASTGSEINIWSLNLALVKEGRLLLPRLQENEIVVYQVSKIDDLVLSKHNILEPNNKSSKKVDPKNLSCILVPALGFDKAFHRLGYGYGHYDRFLATLGSCTTIGIGFKEQLTSDFLPIDSHDIHLSDVLLF